MRHHKEVKNDENQTIRRSPYFYFAGSSFFEYVSHWQDDTANQYYLAAVKSMTQSFHNFFYASFDPSGFVTVDKPPVVLWIQTIFALIFGVHTWSVIIPQALAGVGSVFLLYRMIKPTFGIGAARISALVMALTPIAVALSRTNNIDSMLVFTILLGSACLFRAVKQGKLVWLLTAFALIGLAFNMKMMQAFMVLPAFVLFYLVAYRVSLKKKIGSLLLSLVLLTGFFPLMGDCSGFSLFLKPALCRKQPDQLSARTGLWLQRHRASAWANYGPGKG